MKQFNNPSRDEWPELLRRPQTDPEALEQIVREVFQRVSEEGDEAVLRYTEQFDGIRLDSLILSRERAKLLADKTPDNLKKAIDLAYDNIFRFHQAQQGKTIAVDTQPGVSCWQEKKPISKVGIYIPGGTAPLFSTVLMLAIPAKIAGCSEVVLCSPPDSEGGLHPAICYAALKCGVTTLCLAGGIQAVAALTFGTESIPAVYKIFGPGNQYVTQAKQWATRYGLAIDMPAGPSELLVLADDTADAQFVAADLLSQAEHGTDSQVILCTDHGHFAEEVAKELRQQVLELPREKIARAAIANSRLIVLTAREDLSDLVNAYGPEHLIICHREESYFLDKLENAGSVFLGNYSPESAGDYASGTNHTLPTNGFARQYSGVNLDSYTKAITYQRISSEGIQKIGPAIETMAAAEGLEAHKKAVSFRLSKLVSHKNPPNS